jgi:hypothetical protein
MKGKLAGLVVVSLLALAGCGGSSPHYTAADIATKLGCSLGDANHTVVGVAVVYVCGKWEVDLYDDSAQQSDNEVFWTGSPYVDGNRWLVAAPTRADARHAHDVLGGTLHGGD